MKKALITLGLSIAIIIFGVVAIAVGEIAGLFLLEFAGMVYGGAAALQPDSIQGSFIRYLISQAITIALLVGFVAFLRGNAERLGLGKVKNWTFALLLPLIYLGCLMVSGAIMLITSLLVPEFNLDQPQELGLPTVNTLSDTIITGLLLVVFVPLAEEFIFRGYLFGMLRQRLPFWLVTVVVSLLFGLAHLGETFQWNVVLDTFILSLVLCFLREKTGSVWTGVALHALKNFVAFLLLYVFNVV